jgi:hypothetical protein
MNRHDYAVLTPLAWFPHVDPSDLPNRSLDVMSSVTPCHVPQTVTSDVPSTLTCYSYMAHAWAVPLVSLQHTATHCNTLQHTATHRRLRLLALLCLSVLDPAAPIALGSQSQRPPAMVTSGLTCSILLCCQAPMSSSFGSKFAVRTTK